MGQAGNNVHTNILEFLKSFKKVFKMISVPGSATHGPMMSSHICEVSTGGVVMAWLGFQNWKVAMSTRPARTTQQDPVSKQTKPKKPKQE